MASHDQMRREKYTTTTTTTSADDDQQQQQQVSHFESHTLVDTIQPNNTTTRDHASPNKKGETGKLGVTSMRGLTEGAAVGKKGAAYNIVKDATLKVASDTTVGVRDSMEGLNAGVGGVVEGIASATEKVIGGSLEATALAGAELAKGVTQSMEGLNAGVAGVVEGTAHKLLVGATYASRQKAGTLETNVAGVVKDAALGAVELASDTAEGVTESMEGFNAGVAGLVEGTALVTQGVAQNTFSTMADGGRSAAELASKAMQNSSVGGFVESAAAKAVDMGKKQGLREEQYKSQPPNKINVLEDQLIITTTTTIDE